MEVKDRLKLAESALKEIKENANGCCICDDIWGIADKYFCPEDYEDEE